MIVSNNTLLNILLPNDNKALKEVLKEADNKSLTSTKTTNIQEVLKNLVNNLKSETKSNETVLNMLKNSSVFKNMGNFSTNLESLIKNLPNDESMATLKSNLQSFLVNIKDLDENKLKDLIQKSGIFLESKIANTTAPNPNIQKLTDILTQIKELIKNDTSPKAKELSQLIDKIITQNSNNKSSPTLQNDIKQAIDLLKSISTQATGLNSSKIVQLTNQLETMTASTKLAESKIQNSALPQTEKSALTNEIKPLLSQLKTELLSSRNPAFMPIIKQIDALLQSNDIFSKNPNSMEPKNIMQSLSQSSVMNQAAKEVPKLTPLLSQLATLVDNIEKAENSILKGQMAPNKIQNLQQEVKQVLTQLQSALNEVKGVDVKGVNQVIDKLLNAPNLFSKIELSPPQKEQLLQQMQQGVKPSVQNNQTQSNQTPTNPTQQTASNQAPTSSTTNSTIQQNSNLQSSLKTTAQVEPEVKIVSNDAKPTTQIKSDTSSPTIQINLGDKTAVNKTETSALQNSNNTSQNTTENKEMKPLLGNLSENIKSIITAIKSSMAQIQLQNATPTQNSENFNSFEVAKSMSKLETLFLSKFDTIQNQLLQNTKSPQDILQNDIKSTLLQLQDELSQNPKFQDLSKSVDKLLTHIDYYQMLSVTSSSNYLYLPFVWDMLEDGSVSMKKLKEDHYFCEIHLTLKEFGKMDLLLGLYDDNSLDISIFSEKDFVKDIIKEHLVELKVGLNKVGIVPQNIKILDLKDEEELKEEPINVYHNPYDSSDLGFGVDIKV